MKHIHVVFLLFLLLAPCCAIKHANMGGTLFPEEDYGEQIDWLKYTDSNFYKNVLTYGITLDTTEWKFDFGELHLYWRYHKLLYHQSDTAKKHYGITSLPADDSLFCKFIIREYYKNCNTRVQSLTRKHQKQFIKEITKLTKRQRISSPYLYHLYLMHANDCIKDRDYDKAAHWLALGIEACHKVHEHKDLGTLYALASCVACHRGDSMQSYSYADLALTYYPQIVANTFSQNMPIDYSGKNSVFGSTAPYILSSIESLLQYYYNNCNPYQHHRKFIESEFFHRVLNAFNNTPLAQQYNFILQTDSVIERYNLHSPFHAFFDLCLGAYNRSIWDLEAAQSAYQDAGRQAKLIDHRDIFWMDSLSLVRIGRDLFRIGLIQDDHSYSREVREMDSIRTAFHSYKYLKVWPHEYAEYVKGWYEAAATQYFKGNYFLADSLMEYYFTLCEHPDTLAKVIFSAERQDVIEPALNRSCCIGYHISESLLIERLERYRRYQISNVTKYLLNLPEIERDFAWDRMVGQLNHLHNASLLRYKTPTMAEAVFDNVLHTRTLALTSDRVMKQMTTVSPEQLRDTLERINAWTWKDVAERLDSTEASIEIVMAHAIDNPRGSATYYALMLNGKTPHPIIVELCRDSVLNSIVAPALFGNARHINDLYSWEGRGAELYKYCISPLLPHLKGIKCINIAASGLLTRINLAAIPCSAEDRVMDRYQIHLVSTTALDLQEESKNSFFTEDGITLAFATAQIYGGIDYYSEDTLNNTARYRDNRDGLLYLAGSRVEADTIAHILEEQGCNVIKKVGSEGTEASVKALDGCSSDLLHFATHTFYIEDDTLRQQRISPSTESLSRKMQPLRYTGLHLAGSASAWFGHTPSTRINDGLLTAEEIAKLDLSNTQLVVLSACNSGLGRIDEVDGVIGLQRAFKRAGVQTIVMSLWPVPDETTKLLMQYFYTNLMIGENCHQALVHAMQTLRQNPHYEKPHYWAGFVVLD